MDSSIITDQQLLTAFALGDNKATSEIYRKNFPIIKGWIIKNGGSDGDVADIFQEAVVVLFGKIQEEDFVLTCSIGTYLFSVCKNFWYKKLEKKKRGPGIFSSDILGEIIENYVSEHDSDIKNHREQETYYEKLNDALDQLGEPCRSLLKAYYHEDKSMQQISVDFGYTNSENAKNQKYKCLKRLKKQFLGE